MIIKLSKANAILFLIIKILLSFIFLDSPAQAEKLQLPERIRGLNCRLDTLNAKAVQNMAKMGVNTLRVMIFCNNNEDSKKKDIKPPETENPLKYYDKALSMLDTVVNECLKNNIRLIITPGDYYGRKSEKLWKKEEGKPYREHLIKFWEAFIIEYGNRPGIVAYDVLSEPEIRYDNKQEVDVWYDDFLPETIKTIRALDQDVWIAIGPPGSWNIFFSTMKHFDDPRILYTFHYYTPIAYTHQGIFYKPSHGKLTYPGKYTMIPTEPVKYWDKGTMIEDIKSTVDFARTHKVRIFVGEFGVVRWAPGREQWIKDTIEIWEKEGFDWIFHSYAGWNGWNHTFGQDAASSMEHDGGKCTPAFKALLDGLSKNNRPQDLSGWK